MLAGVPPVDRDGLTHHLYVPKLYLQNGGIYEIPYIPFSYYPMNLDLLYMLPLYFNNDIAPKYIHFAFAIITAIMIFKYLTKRLDKEHAMLGALFFLTVPVIVRLSSTVYVDLGLICFLFASILCIFNWIESGFKLKPLVLSSFFCGLALGTKYNGLLGLFLLGMFIPFVYVRYHNNIGSNSFGTKSKIYLTVKTFGWAALFVFISLLVFSPWMYRNFKWTDNPVYPLYNSFFNTDKFHSKIVTEDESETVLGKRSKMTHIQIRKEVYGESWIEIALIPFRVFFQGKDDSPKYFDGKLNVFLLVLPIFAFIGFRNNESQVKIEILLMLAFSVFMLLYACAMTGTRIRYFSPIIPPLVILSIFGFFNISKLLKKYLSVGPGFIKTGLVVFIFILMMLPNCLYIIERFKKDQPFVYIFGKATRDDYIQAFRPEYASFKYANENLDKNSKIFGLYLGNRGYYSDRHIEFPIEKLQKAASQSGSGEDVAKILKNNGFTHLLVSVSLFNFWVQKYSLHERRVLKDFFDYNTEVLFSKDKYSLLSIK
jgi:hypothetical protein